MVKFFFKKILGGRGRPLIEGNLKAGWYINLRNEVLQCRGVSSIFVCGCVNREDKFEDPFKSHKAEATFTTPLTSLTTFMIK